MTLDPSPPELTCQVACDIVLDLSLTMTISVQLYRNKTGWRNTDALITRLIW